MDNSILIMMIREIKRIIPLIHYFQTDVLTGCTRIAIDVNAVIA